MPTVRIRADYDAHSEGTLKTADATTLRVGNEMATLILYRAGIRFPLASLPATPDISRVELEVLARTAGGSETSWDIHPYNNTGQGNPSTDNAATFYPRCEPDGTPYVGATSLFRCIGRHRLLLGLGIGAAACTDLEAAKAAGSYFSLGLHGVFALGANNAECTLDATDRAGETMAELIITYNETVAVTALLKALAVRVDEQHYVSSTFSGVTDADTLLDTKIKDRDNYWNDHWMMVGPPAGEAGQSRPIQSWTFSTSTFQMRKAFGSAPSAAEPYEVFPFPPELGVRAINSAIAELFPAYVFLPQDAEVLVVAYRGGFYQMPAGIEWADSVECRGAALDFSWYPLIFERCDETRLQLIETLPSGAGALRVRGRHRLTLFDQDDPLTLTQVTELTYPDSGQVPRTELVLTVAERMLHEWLLADYDKAPAIGPGYVAMNRKLDDLRERERALKAQVARMDEARLRDMAVKRQVRPPVYTRTIVNPMAEEE